MIREGKIDENPVWAIDQATYATYRTLLTTFNSKVFFENSLKSQIKKVVPYIRFYFPDIQSKEQKLFTNDAIFE